MMNFRLTLAVFFASASAWFCAAAQENPVKLSYKVNADKSVTFNFDKTDPGFYTVVLKFDQLTNTADPGNRKFEARGYSGTLTTLTPTNKDQGIGFSYSYSSIRGKLNPKYNAAFVYTLPAKNGAKMRAVESSFVNATYFGNTTPEDWKVYRFSTKEEDTVTAIRKGIVVEVKDLYDSDLVDGIAYTSKTNDLIVEHADGTLANYRGLKKGSFAVKVGQTVYPGTALGLNSKSNGGNVYGVSILLMYLKSADFESVRNKTMATTKSLYGFITPHFCIDGNADAILTSQQEYTVSYLPEVIKKEFTKKELKQQVK
ncbi:hypothetical protein EA772_08645 [Pedobacter sp. G11]|uniref:M23 family metallopeptidase n=1 Tax=Pedobacter sp. G11 TaxID=2482728 RepID=UPI000F5FEAFD|nr:M23 family metallopeptidase [Pedobacter sp. G11]AZI25409.1 hypothetical protein EA772_08645 [Pedobacter sp. G11]